MQNNQLLNNTMLHYRGRFSVAPMLDWTDRHCRYFHRQFSQNALLYTEMITTGAIVHAKYDHLKFSLAEQPVALQLGGNNPEQLAHCAQLAEQYGYNEVNLNIGCPSGRVQNGAFGACLMAHKDLVASCVNAMQAVTSIPITVKTRIGIDDLDSYEFLADFIATLVEKTNCIDFVVHARKALLSGLSPKQNREIPPLDYARVYQLKRDFPQLKIAINGGIKSIEDMLEHLQFVDGVMLGREAYQNPSLLGLVDQTLFDSDAEIVTPRQAILKMYPYIEQQLSEGSYLNHITRHMVNAFKECKGARQWRRYLSDHAHLKNAGLEVLESALSFVEEDVTL